MTLRAAWIVGLILPVAMGWLPTHDLSSGPAGSASITWRETRLGDIGDDHPGENHLFESNDGCEASLCTREYYDSTMEEAIRGLARYAVFHHRKLYESPGAIFVEGPVDHGKNHMLVAYLPRSGRRWIAVSSPIRLNWRARVASFARFEGLSVLLDGSHELSVDSYSSVLYLAPRKRQVALDKHWYGFVETLGGAPGHEHSFVYEHEPGWVDVFGYKSQEAAAKHLYRDDVRVRRVRPDFAVIEDKRSGAERGFIESRSGVTLRVSASYGSPKLTVRSHELADEIFRKCTAQASS